MFALLLTASLIQDQAPTDLKRFVYPLEIAQKSPRVTVDVSDFPESKAWGEAARGLVETWFPTVCSLLATEGFHAPSEIKLVIKKEISAPAWANGSTITISGKWITQHPDDLGMVIHELTHVVQNYPGSKSTPGWLVEGIADYVRWWRYEPEAPRPKVDPSKSKYTDSYRTTAAWLAWTSRKYNMGLVPALDRAMRKREDPMPLFERLTGKNADDLWSEYVASLK